MANVRLQVLTLRTTQNDDNQVQENYFEWLLCQKLISKTPFNSCTRLAASATKQANVYKDIREALPSKNAKTVIHVKRYIYSILHSGSDMIDTYAYLLCSVSGTKISCDTFHLD